MSTIHLGDDLLYEEKPYETMMFDVGPDDPQYRHATLEEALACHQRLVDLL